MYELHDGLTPGSYKVSIHADELVSNNSVRWHAPKKFSNPDTSGLVIEIVEETDSLNFDVSWDDSDSKHSKPWVEKLQ